MNLGFGSSSVSSVLACSLLASGSRGSSVVQRRYARRIFLFWLSSGSDDVSCAFSRFPAPFFGHGSSGTTFPATILRLRFRIIGLAFSGEQALRTFSLVLASSRFFEVVASESLRPADASTSEAAGFEVLFCYLISAFGARLFA